jgi:streptomycin 6-kinase
MARLEIPEALCQSVASDRDYGPRRRAWLEQLPVIVAELTRRWSLVIGPPFRPGGCTSWVAPATTAACSRKVVIKVCWCHPDAEELHEAEGLAVWAGNGTVRLLNSACLGETKALLLEACEPGTALCDAMPANEQDVIAAGLLRRLWIEPPAGHSFRPLQAMCGMWASQFESEWQAAPADQRIDADLAQAGMGLLRSLPATADQEVLLATDLHPDNVLAAQREPWLVIDPKPYVGDPAYDPVQYMLNFGDRLTADPIRFAYRMAGLLGVDPLRVRSWLFARCVQESNNDPQLRIPAAQLAP